MTQEKQDVKTQEEALNESFPEELDEPWDPRAEASVEMELERGDRFAMLVSGCLTVAIPVGIMIALISVVTLLLFSR